MCDGRKSKADAKSIRTIIKRSMTPTRAARHHRRLSQIRKEHPAIERKLHELVRWHDGRRVRYRGRPRVQVQYLILAVVVNCKRIVRLLHAAPSAALA